MLILGPSPKPDSVKPSVAVRRRTPVMHEKWLIRVRFAVDDHFLLSYGSVVVDLGEGQPGVDCTVESGSTEDALSDRCGFNEWNRKGRVSVWIKGGLSGGGLKPRKVTNLAAGHQE